MRRAFRAFRPIPLWLLFLPAASTLASDASALKLLISLEQQNITAPTDNEQAIVMDAKAKCTLFAAKTVLENLLS